MDPNPALRRPTQKLPHPYVDTAANFVPKVAGQMGHKRRPAEPVAAHA